MTRYMTMCIHFFNRTWPDEVNFGADREGHSWHWNADVLVVKHHNGDRREYPARNIRLIEINKFGTAA